MHKPARFDSSYINEFPNVLTHNDCHQNNIMMSMRNNLDLILIDFEYAGWNPMAMDVACYINETMNDNSYPGDNGIKWYLTNLMTVQEQEEFIKTFLKHYFFNYMPSQKKLLEYGNDVDVFLDEHLQPFQRQVWDCCLLNNFFWGVWALSLLSELEFLKTGIFNFDFADSRCEMNKTFQ